MMGVSYVALSSMWGGRLHAMRMSFFYMACLVIVFAVKVNNPDPSRFFANTTPNTTTNTTPNTTKEKPYHLQLPRNSVND